uniref:Uncharacterized protein n=1 Tax=Setaria viridis TaxID=4556 RepID=A0A4U6W2V7_SETVI|nr:hypothetical protein SEVIR_2G128700v2 [Setaria viridis]
MLAAFMEKGLLPSKQKAHWRAPAPGEDVPHPWPNEVISFLAFHERKLSPPLHWFLHRLLNDFVTVCEDFLGMEPHKRTKLSIAYPSYSPNNSNRGWHGEWFYLGNPPEAPFPNFTGNRLDVIEVALRKCMEEGLNGRRAFATFIYRWVTPLAERMRRIWEYFGMSDPDRASSKELLGDEIWGHLGRVLQSGQQLTLDGMLKPFYVNRTSEYCTFLSRDPFFSL